MRDLTETLKAAQASPELEPLIRLTLSLAGKDDIVIEQDRILRMPSQEETTDSQVTEVICDNSDGYFTSPTFPNLKGWDALLERGLVTEAEAGVEYSAVAPLKVISQYLPSAPGVLQCRLSLVGIPNLLAEDKASKDYFHHWSDLKTVKDILTEIADGKPVSTELTEEQADYDSYIKLDVNHGAGQRLTITKRTVTKLAFRLKKTGSPTGTNVTFRIRRATGDTAILAWKTFPIASIGTVPAWCEVTLDPPLAVNEEVWIYCEHTDGTDSHYISVSYNSVAIKPEEWFMKVDPEDGPVDFTDLDCAYRYKYTSGGTSGGIDCWERGTSPETYCKSYEVVYDPHGTHTGGTHATIMTDSEAAFKTDALIGQVIYNVTDGSKGTITDNDATTVTVTSLAGGSDNQWENGDVYTIEDSLLQSYQPKDALRIYEGQNRLDVINRLLGYTGCVKIVKADGKIHIFVPVTSGEVYDSEYSLAEGSHTFFSKAVREALVIPSRIVVKSLKTDENQYSGAATSAVSFALLPITGAPIRTKLVNGAQGVSIAQAMISRLEMAAQRGAASVPMNLGSEVFDYVKVTDSRAGDSRVGNLGYLRRSYDGRSQDAKEACPMDFSFGRVRIKSVPGTRPSLLPEAMAVPEPTLEEAILRWGMIKPILEIIEQNFDDVWGVEGGQSLEILGEDASISGLWRQIIEIYTALGWFKGESPTNLQILLALLNYYTKAQVNEKLDDVSLSTPARAFDTNYQNGSKVCLVQVAWESTGAGDQGLQEALIGSSSPPTTLVNKAMSDQAAYPQFASMSFLVPPDYYYQVKSILTAPTKRAWVEYDLH